MKLALFALALVTSFSATKALAHGYDQSHYVKQMWSGEYPNGFAVVKNGVKLQGRTGMDRALPKSVSCEVPKRMVFHPWNAEARATFWTASKINPLRAQVDLELGEGNEKVQVKKGELIEFLIYGAEGHFLVRYNGKEYGADQELLEKTEHSPRGFKQEEWIHIRCMDGKKAWIDMKDVMTAEDDAEPEYVRGLAKWYLGFREYGKVTNLTDADLRKPRD